MSVTHSHSPSSVSFHSETCVNARRPCTHVPRVKLAVRWSKYLRPLGRGRGHALLSPLDTAKIVPVTDQLSRQTTSGKRSLRSGTCDHHTILARVAFRQGMCTCRRLCPAGQLGGCTSAHLGPRRVLALLAPNKDLLVLWTPCRAVERSHASCAAAINEHPAHLWAHLRLRACHAPASTLRGC